MYGAIFGDIIGSRFEFNRGEINKDFKLFTEEDRITDDTVMTVAVAEALLNAGKDAEADTIRTEVIRSMRSWGRKYPSAGYGGRFFSWLFAGEPKPYNSYGNGSAMRVSPAGWLYDSLERSREAARATAEVTHNHPEGIKGAECTAAVIYLARNGSSKEEIREYVIKEFGYNLSESLEELRERHEHDVSCMDSLPKALVSFLEGESYEDTVRNAVFLGGDTDTNAAIAGSMAEAFFGIQISIIAEGLHFLPEDIREVINRFNTAIGRGGSEQQQDQYANNAFIKAAAARFAADRSEKKLLELLNVLTARMLEQGEAPTPMVDINSVVKAPDILASKLGDTFTLGEQLVLRFDTMQDEAGNEWLPLFTDDDELAKGETSNIRLNVLIEVILSSAVSMEKVKGIVINPFGAPLTLPKELLDIPLSQYRALTEKKS